VIITRDPATSPGAENTAGMEIGVGGIRQV
jgi:hypothetical protein